MMVQEGGIGSGGTGYTDDWGNVYVLYICHIPISYVEKHSAGGQTDFFSLFSPLKRICHAAGLGWK